jgi:pSer/pThr/pTyr-binding forkhead associated (FHA) protein
MNVRLKILGGALSGVVVQMQHSKFLVGRERDCLLRPDSPTVSRHHCVLLLDEYTLRVRDLGSKNGTYLNGHRVLGEQFVHHDDLISVGEITIQVDFMSGLENREGVTATETLTEEASERTAEVKARARSEGSGADESGDCDLDPTQSLPLFSVPVKSDGAVENSQDGVAAI